MVKEKTKTITSIGGQALIEGIMMRGPKQTSVAVRVPDGSISTEYLEAKYLRDRFPILRKPFLRGIASFIESMQVGYKALSYSAEKSGMDDEEDENPSKFDQWLNRVFGDKIMGVVMGIGAVLGVALALLLFFVLPTWLCSLLGNAIPEVGAAGFWRSLTEGVMRIGIFVGYMALVARMKEIHRVFQYHGAEHKSIFCYENEEELTVENVRKYRRFHPRCGTSFMILMLLLGIILGIFIPVTQPLLRSVIKILCLPLMVSLGFELIRICGKYDNALTRIIAAPGVWMQHITTKEPDDSMIEVAIDALKAVIPENGEDKIQK